jgi:hypothetical protein
MLDADTQLVEEQKARGPGTAKKKNKKKES